MVDNTEPKIYFADLESTGLLHHLIEQGDKAKLHNFCAMSVDGKNMWTLHTDTDNERKTLQRFLDRDIILVMHNGIQYDKYALKHFGYDVDKVHFVDTLALSWYLDLYRAKHGLILEVFFISNDSELNTFEEKYWLIAKEVSQVLIDYVKTKK